MSTIRILVVDDHPVVRRGVASIFDCESDMEVVGAAGSVNEALELMRQTEVDVVITDMRMDGADGDILVTEIQSCFPNVKTAVLTNFHSDEEVFRAIRAGVNAFLLKTTPMEEIISAVRAIHAGEKWIPEHIAVQLMDRVSREELSVRELQILQLLTQGMTNREIGQELGISENTVRNHMNHLLEKMDSRDRTGAVTTALRQGLVRLDD
jgi:two-component system NarL family response regulator